MRHKVLFFDIDGTLLDGQRGVPEIPKGVKKELKRLQANGHKLFISSGRPKAMMNLTWVNENFDGFVLTNGGYVEIDGKSIFEDRMDTNLTRKTIEMLEKFDCDYMIATADKLYIDPKCAELFNFFVQFGHNREMFTTIFDKEEVISRAIKVEANVTNEDKQKIESYIKSDFGYVINADQHGSDNAFEFYSPTISKAVGIKKVLDYYGLDISDTYAFGDGANDIEMIEFCHVGVAMGNACEALKAKADIICRPIEDNGLENILKILFPQS